MEQTEADTTAILPEDVLSSQTEEDSCSDGDLHTYKDEKDVASRYRSANGPLSPCALGVTVEPVAFFCYFSFALQSPLYMQYLWERISGDLGYNGTKERGCGNSSGPQHTLEKEVETLTTYWSMYINLGSFAVCLFTVPLLGSWSDCAGRRKLLILSSLGLVLQAAVFLMVVYFRLHVAWFFLGKTLSGLTGDLNTLLAGCFAYVADVSDAHSRTFRVALLEATLGLSSILASAIGGPWLRAQGYIGPFWLVLACGLAAAVYVCLFLRESVTPDPDATLFTLKHYKAVFRLCCSREQGYSRARLWLYFFSMFVVVVVHFGTHNLYVLYELSAPLCWGPVLIGIGSASMSMSYLCSLVGLRIMRRYVNDSWMAIVGLVSNMAGLVVISMANTTALMFTGYAIIFLYLVPTPVLRSKLSKLVSASNQGALFAAVACIVEMCSLVANSVFGSLYPATLNIMKGLPFLLGAGLLLIPMAIIWAVRCQEEREESNLLTEIEPGQE